MNCNKKRILVIGNSGSGKSTFSKFLGENLNIPVTHLDKIFWKPGWETRNREEFDSIIKEIILKDNWIIDGNYTRTLGLRASRAELIYFFDYPVNFCVYRIYKRIFRSKFRIERRYDISEGCHERWYDREFVDFVRNFNKNSRPRIYSDLEEISFNKNNLVIFKNRKEFDKYKNSMKESKLSDQDPHPVMKSGRNDR
ncbi:MAG TPA: hypothetical protein PKC91_07760 [Ignavibacteria bacterium]|nr:hypothetical protein [Ignavibacteria bacterium]